MTHRLGAPLSVALLHLGQNFAGVVPVVAHLVATFVAHSVSNFEGLIGAHFESSFVAVPLVFLGFALFLALVLVHPRLQIFRLP
jgi:hypothetical protein